ncbi:MAG: hypothetical protein EOO24_01440 [Comamonadaceae bacterium]|nr:MAG: hypothetical protein EOO24_01440 [Comamonadaceae bacterium]
MAIATSTTQIQRFANALYGVQLGSVTLAQVQSDVGTGGIAGLPAVFNAYYNASFGGMTSAQVADTILNNVGINVGTSGIDASERQAAKDYIVANLNSAPAGERGNAVATMLNHFSGMTADGTFGAAATAYNMEIDDAVTWGNTQTANAGSNESTPFGEISAYLETGRDVVSGTSADDVFMGDLVGNANTFQSGDVISGGAGVDMLYAVLGNESDFAIRATTNSVEQAVFVSQANNLSGSNGSNNADTTGDKNTVDAERMVGVQEWWNTDSRADLKIEDVRILDGEVTRDITIVMRNTDPGSNIFDAGDVLADGELDVGAGDNAVDYEVYFSDESLRAAGSVTTTSVTVYVASQLQQTNTNLDFYDPAKPLANLPYDTLRVLATPNGSDTPIEVILRLDLNAAAAANGRTIATLTEADFELALRTAVTEVSGGGAQVITNVDGYTFTSTDGVIRNVNTYSITAQNFAITLPATNVWQASQGLPPTNAFSASASSGIPSTTEALITSSIILDNVGREDEAGSLTVGGMGTRIGVERFEIKVASNDDNDNQEHNSGSWISRAQSTNNYLQEVQVTHVVASDNYREAGVIDGRQVDANATANTRTLDQITNANADYLYIGTGTDQEGNNLGELRDFPGLLNADGLRDVRLFDAATFKGDLKIGAYFDEDTIRKYQDLVDDAADDGADDVDFLYELGSGNDSLNVTIDPSAAFIANNIAAERHDFDFTFNGNAGNDNIQVAIRDVSSNGVIGGTDFAWYNNQSLNANVTIDGGSGDDVIRKPGAGDAIIIGGAGNDVIYAENTGSDGLVGPTDVFNDSLTDFSDDGIVGNDGFAEFVFNALPSTVLPGSFPLDNLRSAGPVSVSAVNANLTVDFMGFTKTVNIGNSALTGNQTITDLTINQAIKNAINNDAVLSTMLVAEDGPGRTLIVRSLIDGVMDEDTLTVSLGNTPLSATQTGFNLFDATEFTAFTGSATGVYTTNLATTLGGIEHSGADSTLVSDNTITPGLGDDVIVLGTAGYGLLGNQLLGSNDTIVYQGFDNGRDTIVHFDTTATTVATPDVVTPVIGAPAFETVTLTFSNSDGSPGGQTIVFDGDVITLSTPTQGVIPAVDVAYQFSQQFAGANYVVSDYVFGTNTVEITRIASGTATDVTAADFTGTYTDPAATGGGGTVTPVVTTQGATGGALGTASQFTVNFDVANTAAAAAGSFTFDGTTVAYTQGAGAAALALALDDATFANFNTTVVDNGGTVSVTFTETIASQADATADATGTAADFDLGTNNIAGSITGITAGTASTGPVTTTVTPGQPAGAGGQGFDYLDFSAYNAAAVYVGNTLVAGSLTASDNDYVQLVQSLTNAGEYTVTVHDSGTDGFGAGDTLVGTVGVIDFGATQAFVAANFIL